MRRIAVCVGLLVGLSAFSHATLITYTFTGTVSSITDAYGHLAGVGLSDPVSGSFIYDPEAPFTGQNSWGNIFQPSTATALSMVFDSGAASFPKWGGTLQDDQYWTHSDSEYDGVAVFQQWSGTDSSSNNTWEMGELEFRDHDGTALPDGYQLPGSIDYAAYDEAVGTWAGTVYLSGGATQSFNVSFTISNLSSGSGSAVPEPASCALLAMAMGGLGAMLRRRPGRA